jgi:hypothetical protein
MLKTWMSGGPSRRVVEDPEGLGYRVVADPLLEVMEAEGWYALERAATRQPCSCARSHRLRSAPPT